MSRAQKQGQKQVGSGQWVNPWRLMVARGVPWSVRRRIILIVVFFETATVVVGLLVPKRWSDSWLFVALVAIGAVAVIAALGYRITREAGKLKPNDP